MLPTAAPQLEAHSWCSLYICGISEWRNGQSRDPSQVLGHSAAPEMQLPQQVPGWGGVEGDQSKLPWCWSARPWSEPFMLTYSWHSSRQGPGCFHSLRWSRVCRHRSEWRQLVGWDTFKAEHSTHKKMFLPYPCFRIEFSLTTPQQVCLDPCFPLELGVMTEIFYVCAPQCSSQ